MNSKSELTKNRKFRFIRRELGKLYGEAGVDRIIDLARQHYADGLAACRDATEGEWQHLEGTILPTVSFYKALLQVDGEHALENVHAIMMRLCEMGGAAVGTVMKLPGMKSLFMWVLPRMANKMFGPSCGFQFENYKACRNMLKMDMTACPYCRYALRLDCPELMRVFCDSDFATYGNLPGIEFVRTQTLGTGGSRCDFQFIRK